MDFHNIITSSHAELPAMLFALRLGGRGRRSYCRPKFNYSIQSDDKGFIKGLIEEYKKHPFLFFFTLGCLLFLAIMESSRR